MTAIAAPEAPVTTIRNRKATTDFPLGKDSEGSQVVASVTSHHNKENRVLVAYVTRVAIKESGTPGIVIRSSFPMDAVRVMTDPIGRYSDKALASFHDDAMAAVEHYRDSQADSRLNAVFAPVA